MRVHTDVHLHICNCARVCVIGDLPPKCPPQASLCAGQVKRGDSLGTRVHRAAWQQAMAPPTTLAFQVGLPAGLSTVLPQRASWPAGVWQAMVRGECRVLGLWVQPSVHQAEHMQPRVSPSAKHNRRTKGSSLKTLQGRKPLLAQHPERKIGESLGLSGA